MTGAKVIAGAEFNCAENGDCKTFPSPYREKVLRAFNSSVEAIDAWGEKKVNPSGHDDGPGCNFPGCSLKYLNTGFIAAKARDLRWFATQWLHNFEKNVTYGRTDQGCASAVMRDHPNEIVLDYAGALVNNLFGNIRKNGHNENMFEFDVDRKTWVNTALGMDACFFHGNGNVDLPDFGTTWQAKQSLHNISQVNEALPNLIPTNATARSGPTQSGPRSDIGCEISMYYSSE